MEFSRQNISTGNLPNPGIKPGSPALQADYLLSKPLKCLFVLYNLKLSPREPCWIVLHLSFREGNGKPLQYSCLENPMDREATGSQRVGHDWATSPSPSKALSGVCCVSQYLRTYSIILMDILSRHLNMDSTHALVTSSLEKEIPNISHPLEGCVWHFGIKQSLL